ncbi:MAG: ABC transporter permease [Chloroflexi bacterium]|nr:ABC transporter permease [Chloroflexota bacterium]
MKLVVTLAIVGWIIGLIAALLRIFLPFFKQGWPYALIGVALTALGFLNESAWQAYIGASVAVYGFSMLALAIMVRVGVREAIASRICYTVAGVLILVMWALPQRYTDFITEELNANVEMFIFAGFFMVASSVWIIMYNSDVIVRGLQATLGRFTAVRPIMKPAVAYAVANRFRTGLTVSMFALVIFVLMSFSILNQSFSGLLQTPENVTGGFDVRANIDDDLPIEDIKADIDASPDLELGDFELIVGQSDIELAGRQTDGEEARFLELRVRGTEPEYFRATKLKITAADAAYLPDNTDLSDEDERARAVWDALAENPDLVAISSEHAIDFEVIGPDPTEGLMKLEDVDFGESGYEFQAKEIEIVSGDDGDGSMTVKRTVIAVIDDLAESLEGESDGGPAPGFQGIYTDHQIFSELSDEPVPFTIYRMNIAEGVDPTRVASTLQTVFLDNSMLAVDTEEELSTAVAQNEQFSLLFQGFMGLGLVVGVAALGVLSLRAVNERRMQIAIMRCIGYRARMIRIQFIMESIFITVIGTGLGMGLGALISWSFLDDISGANQGLTFDIPWGSILLVVAITVIAALITTYVPARQASQVYPAEALRYE